MNRFFRSALFPLIVIVLLVYLASQTLIPRRDEQKKATYSELIRQVEDGNVNQVLFTPNDGRSTRRSSAARRSRSTTRATSRSTRSASLEAENVKFDSKGTGSSAWWTILTSLLPFVLLFDFWIFLMNQVQGGGSKVMSFGRAGPSA